MAICPVCKKDTLIVKESFTPTKFWNHTCTIIKKECKTCNYCYRYEEKIRYVSEEH